MIAPDEVRRIAQLAKLQLTDQQVERFSHELTEVVDAMAQLQQVDTTGVPMADSEPVAAEAVRADVPQTSSPSPILENVPDRAGEYVRIKTGDDA